MCIMVYLSTIIIPLENLFRNEHFLLFAKFCCFAEVRESERRMKKSIKGLRIVPSGDFKGAMKN